MPLDGFQLGRYHLSHQLGAGGMGEVYLAEDARIGRQVAIKVIKNDLTPHSDTKKADDANRLFLREAKAVAALQHPHILPLFDYGDAVIQGNPISYMVMPYCQEGSLDRWLHKRGSTYLRSLQHVASLLEQAADALQHAHQKFIIHQDVKPPNFLIERWRSVDLPDLQLTDFGIAKFLSSQSSTSQSIRGTPLYMAPEQWEGHPVPATDQYALAIMVYQWLTGHSPFQGNPGQIMYQHLTVQPQPPSALQSEIPAAVDTVVLKALMKKPQERFETVLAFAQAFQQALSSAVLALEVQQQQTQSPASEQKADNVATLRASSHVSHEMGAISSTSPHTTMNNSTSLYSTSLSRRREQIHRPSHSMWSGKWLLLCLLAFILIVGSALTTLYVSRLTFGDSKSSNITDQTNASAQNNNVSGTATALAITSATNATTQAQNINATAQALLHNPYPPYTGVLTLDDPLSNNGKGYSWEEGTRDQGECTFSVGVYHSNISQAGYFHSCLALSSDFSNCAFEVQMTLVTGHAGGIVFRADRATTHLYYFTVDPTGGYLLKAYYDKTGGANVVASGSGVSFSGTGVIGVVLQGDTINLYVNRLLIYQVRNGFYTHGQIGVVVYEGEAVFSNAKIWKL